MIASSPTSITTFASHVADVGVFLLFRRAALHAHGPADAGPRDGGLEFGISAAAVPQDRAPIWKPL